MENHLPIARKAGVTMAKGKYTKKLAEEIVERLSEGEPLRAICRDKEISWRAIYNWIDSKPEFASRIARARQLGEDALAEQCLDISDDEQHDWVMTKKGPLVNDVAIGRAKLQIETRLKLLAKWNPKKFGDSSKLELSGQLSLANMTDDEILDELAQLKAQGIVPEKKK